MSRLGIWACMRKEPSLALLDKSLPIFTVVYSSLQRCFLASSLTTSLFTLQFFVVKLMHRRLIKNVHIYDRWHLFRAFFISSVTPYLLLLMRSVVSPRAPMHTFPIKILVYYRMDIQPMQLATCMCVGEIYDGLENKFNRITVQTAVVILPSINLTWNELEFKILYISRLYNEVYL